MSFLVGIDCSRAERFNFDSSDEATSSDRLSFMLERLMVDVQRTYVFLDQDSVSPPVLEVLRRAVVDGLVTQQVVTTIENQPSNVVGAFVIKLRLRRRVDHIVRGCDQIAQ